MQSSSLNEEEIPGGPNADVHKFLKYGKEKLPHQKTLEVQAIFLLLTHAVAPLLPCVQVDGLLILLNKMFRKG